MKQIFPISIQSGMSQSGSYILMLLEPESGRQIPLFIGQHEANGILIAKEGVATRRPLTHELMLNALNAYGISVDHVTIDRVLDGVFYATLHLIGPDGEQSLDSRPTDAITLALMTNTPIFAADEVVEETGLQSDKVTELQSDKETESIERLEEELRRCEENEEYERAAEIQEKIEKLKDEK